MKLFLSISFFFLIILITLSGCKKDEKNPVTSLSELNTLLLPLKIGNQWTFEYAHYDTLGNIEDSGVGPMTIFGDTTIQGQQWFRQNEFIFDEYVLLGNKNANVWAFNNNNSVSRLLFKYPASVNETYQYPDIEPGTMTITVTSISESVTVPAGTFTCYHYQATSVSEIFHFYLAPGKGWIKAYKLYQPSGGLYYRVWNLDLKSVSIY